MLRPRKTVWLKGYQQPAVRQRFERGQRCLDFCGMVSVIIVNAKSFIGENQLLPARRSGEFLQRRRDALRLESKPMQQRYNRTSVRGILFSAQPQRKPAQGFPSGANLK